ncbi:MAG TPA: hypothetical protein VEH04_07115 [Verrucomicrobiae bacterium]|nr:hypothetical protein [Verrucomicrobiae bacterium]
MSNNQKLKPWAAGPFELIRHGDGHLKGGTDFDKRMALVSFDNAVEVSITTHLQLHPSQRGGKTYEGKKVQHWLSNFHAKLEFLEEFLVERKIPIEVSIDEIVWYHQLRNELYHSGNGMTPEVHCLVEAQHAAVWVFSVLFGVDPKGLLQEAKPVETPRRIIDASQLTGKSLFLEIFIDLERAILGTLRGAGVLPDQAHHVPARKGWMDLKKLYPDLPHQFDELVAKATQVRNALVHGAPVELTEHELLGLADKVEQVTTTVREKMARQKR